MGRQNRAAIEKCPTGVIVCRGLPFVPKKTRVSRLFPFRTDNAKTVMMAFKSSNSI
jgi:hypothetical protein